MGKINDKNGDERGRGSEGKGTTKKPFRRRKSFNKRNRTEEGAPEHSIPKIVKLGGEMEKR
jgi:hypothetical protein